MPIVTTSSRRRPRSHLSLIIRSFLAIAVLTAIAVAVLFLRNRKAEAQKAEVEPPAPAARPVAKEPSAAPVEPPPPPVTKPPAPKELELPPTNIVSRTVVTNRSGAVIEKLVLADGTTMSKVEPPKPVFENAAEQVIALAISTPPGASMPPLPDLTGLEEDFAKSLERPIVITEDDSEEVQKLKERVAETKAYLAEEVKKGGNIIDILREHQEEMGRIEAEQLAAVREMQAIKAEEGDEAAAEDVKRKNGEFRKDGIPELPVPGEAR